MGFFAWLGGLVDQFIEWLGQAIAAFARALVSIIQAVWYTAMVGVLIAAFGYASTLYAIFYAGAILTETLMEVWDYRYSNKPAQVFSVEKAPANTPLPRYRSEVTKVMALTNIQYS
ncbi:MAG TPA: hypothetical protein IGS52_05275 [Oscillatoriaceae cyanobacterium M33_DOE_052]|uniref:Uncharacterized protein n=1 Tax=Planktothricoides sp. SpSt-374 TaxID=2282167 RepID=A0A7C3ZP32_9CYAN|nr:hypothetical protein [Oscillatoriaceae cyanobacterium M33_DOE_052]